MKKAFSGFNRMSATLLLVYASLLITAVAVEADEEGTGMVTLYRNSALDSTMRIHVATFDVDEVNPTYNSENCQIAALLFKEQKGVVVRYWCEPGRYRNNWE